MQFANLLKPGKIGSLEVKNRIIMPAMGTGHSNEDGTVTQRNIDYYTRRTRAGVGLNIIEYSSAHWTAEQPYTLGAFDDKFLPGLTALAKAIHDEGGKCLLQLWHGGRQTSRTDEDAPWSPSAIPLPEYGTIPHEMTVEEIWDVIAGYADAALRAKRAGFDGVEVHGGHGYLVDCFMNLWSNTRNDEFGGALKIVHALGAK